MKGENEYLLGKQTNKKNGKPTYLNTFFAYEFLLPAFEGQGQTHEGPILPPLPSPPKRLQSCVKYGWARAGASQGQGQGREKYFRKYSQCCQRPHFPVAKVAFSHVPDNVFCPSSFFLRIPRASSSPRPVIAAYKGESILPLSSLDLAQSHSTPSSVCRMHPVSLSLSYVTLFFSPVVVVRFGIGFQTLSFFLLWGVRQARVMNGRGGIGKRRGGCNFPPVVFVSCCL